MLKIKLLGKVEILYNDDDISKKMSNKMTSLIYILMSNYGKYVSKEKLMTYLWPDSAEDAARYNLRYNLWSIKKNIPRDENGNELILLDKDSCSLNTDYEFWCDFLAIKNADCINMSIDELLELDNMFSSEIMDGCYLKNCYEFNEILYMDRSECENIHKELLYKMAEHYININEFNEALFVYKKIALLDPYNEQLALNVMDIYVKINNRSAAIEYYRNFEANIWRNLNIVPNKDLKECYKTLLKGAQNNFKEDILDEKTVGDKSELIKINCSDGLDVDYFLISNIIEKMLKYISYECLQSVNLGYVSDICAISREMYIFCEENEEYIDINSLQNIHEARIINAFLHFIYSVCEFYFVEININDFENFDKLSKNVILYLQKQNISTLKITL